MTALVMPSRMVAMDFMGCVICSLPQMALFLCLGVSLHRDQASVGVVSMVLHPGQKQVR